VAVGLTLASLDGYPFEVRYSEGAVVRAKACADIGAAAYGYFVGLFSGIEPDIAFIVADESDWAGRGPYGLPFFRDGGEEIKPGIILMPAGPSDFWAGMVEDLRVATPTGYKKLLTTYPDGRGGIDLQPFFDLITIHELGHAFEVLGDLRVPTDWLSEIFVNFALHAFVATRRPASLPTLEVLATVGAASRALAARMRTEGYSSLEDLQAHYTGGNDSMDPLNYVWYQYRWQRLVAKMFDIDGEDGLVRFWTCFHARDRVNPSDASASAWAPLLSSEVSTTLGRAIREWH
jgi:hypothetical protein